MNPDLLKPFDLEAARNNEPVLFHQDEVEFVGIDNQGGIALCIDGLIRIVSKSALRMRPLAWVEDRPVYKGDKLWHKNGCLVTTGDDGNIYDFCGAPVGWDEVTWEKPEPVKKTRTVKFLGYMTPDESLIWTTRQDLSTEFKRIPSEDYMCEVEE